MSLPTVLVRVGLEYPGARICRSEYDTLLASLAQDHANYMARVDRQGHQHFQSRYQRVREELGLSAVEICAESWPDQRDSSMWEIGQEMFECWQQSSGHWAVASRVHKRFGDGLAQGASGVWYACLLAAD